MIDSRFVVVYRNVLPYFANHLAWREDVGEERSRALHPFDQLGDFGPLCEVHISY